MTKWAHGPTPPDRYRAVHANDRHQHTRDQDVAAQGRSRTLTYISQDSGNAVETTAWVKNDGGSNRRRYLSLAWHQDGKRVAFRVCAVEHNTREKNLRAAWDIIFTHDLLTPSGREAYRQQHPRGHR